MKEFLSRQIHSKIKEFPLNTLVLYYCFLPLSFIRWYFSDFLLPTRLHLMFNIKSFPHTNSVSPSSAADVINTRSERQTCLIIFRFFVAGILLERETFVVCHSLWGFCFQQYFFLHTSTRRKVIYVFLIPSFLLSHSSQVKCSTSVSTSCDDLWRTFPCCDILLLPWLPDLRKGKCRKVFFFLDKLNFPPDTRKASDRWVEKSFPKLEKKRYWSWNSRVRFCSNKQRNSQTSLRLSYRNLKSLELKLLLQVNEVDVVQLVKLGDSSAKLFTGVTGDSQTLIETLRHWVNKSFKFFSKTIFTIQSWNFAVLTIQLLSDSPSSCSLSSSQASSSARRCFWTMTI